MLIKHHKLNALKLKLCKILIKIKIMMCFFIITMSSVKYNKRAILYLYN